MHDLSKNKFCVGDVVIAVDNFGSSGKGLLLGEKYVVKTTYLDVDGDQLVYVEGHEPKCWSTRFELAKNHMPEPDISLDDIHQAKEVFDNLNR